MFTSLEIRKLFLIEIHKRRMTEQHNGNEGREPQRRVESTEVGQAQGRQESTEVGETEGRQDRLQVGASLGEAPGWEAWEPYEVASDEREDLSKMFHLPQREIE